MKKYLLISLLCTAMCAFAQNLQFQCYLDFNQYFGAQNYGAGLETIFGTRMNEYAYIGGGVEYGYLGAGQNAAISMEFPVFVHSKIYLPVNDKFFPHIEMSLGANMGYRFYTPDESLRPSRFLHGIYAKGGVGIDWLDCLSLGVGYQYGEASRMLQVINTAGILKLDSICLSKYRCYEKEFFNFGSISHINGNV